MVSSLPAKAEQPKRRGNDPISWYLQNIGRVPLLTPAEEIELGNQVQKMMILTEDGQLNEADSLRICNALRKMIIIPNGATIDDYRESPAGAGPFYETERIRREIHLGSQYSDLYKYGKPRLQNIKVDRILKFQQESALNEKQNGREGIDIMIDANKLNEANLCYEGSLFKCKAVPSNTSNILVINHRTPKMRGNKGKEFREALDLAIDKSSLEILKGSKVDFSEELIGDSFKISNPKTKASCGCGISFSF